MSPKPGTGRNGLPYHDYVCGSAEKTIGADCPPRFVPAHPLDGAVLQFMKELHLNPERVQAIPKLANESASETIGKLRKDVERVREQLGYVMQKLSHLADILAQGGMSTFATLRERLESSEAERSELESSEARLKRERVAEEIQEIVAKVQVGTLGLFQKLVAKNEDKPQALKALLPRFVDYVVWHSAEKGEGHLEPAFFPQPIALAADLDFSAGQKAGDRCFAPEYQMVGAKGLEPLTSWV